MQPVREQKTQFHSLVSWHLWPTSLYWSYLILSKTAIECVNVPLIELIHEFSPGFVFSSSAWGHTCLMVTQTGWVSRFTALWVSGESNQPLSAQQVQTHLIALTETHNIYCHIPVRLPHVSANSHRRLPAVRVCAHVLSAPLAPQYSSGHASLNCVRVFIVVYCCIA